MNILHISRTMGQGGAEKVVYQICKDSKPKFKMIIASTGGIYEKELLKNNIKHYIIPDINKKNPILMLKTLIILHKIIKNEKIDIIHSHHRMAAFYSRILNIFNKNLKRIYTSHNVFNDKKKLLKFALKGSKIIAVGEGVKNNLINVYHIEESKITVIYNAVELIDNIKKPSDSFILNKDDKIYIASIGRLSEQKGVDVFLNAISGVIKNNKKVYAIIIGDGELKEKLVELTKKLKIENNVLFLGYRKDVIELITCMDFIVLSSRWEGFPLTPIEVFLSKKTMIGSNISGINEIVKNEYNGLLFEKNNVVELNKKINCLIKDIELKKQLENNAYKTYIEKYSYEKFINSYNNVYQDLYNEQ